MAGNDDGVRGEFRVIQSDDPRALRMLVKSLEEGRAGLVQTLCGSGVENWAHYKELVGELRGIDNALRLCSEISTQERRS